jgi:3',5'-cyclic AMP phosphodiesterase CpdA
MLICQLTDLHVRGRGIPANRVVDTNMFAERAFRRVAALSPRPDAVLLTGDLTECGLASEYEVLDGLIRRLLPMPVFAIPGNHDRREEMRGRLAHLPGVTDDPYFIQYAIDDLPVRLVMLDTVVPGFGHGALDGGRMEWLDRTLGADPTKPTIVAMHHPPFLCGIRHMDRINLRDTAEFAAVIARHPQVERIVCGHHHRPIVARVAHAIASIAPSIAHQVELDLNDDAPAQFVLEPPAFQLHHWRADTGVVTHTAYVEAYPGPYPFLTDPDYPGKL